MAKGAATTQRREEREKTPVSVVLPTDLRARVKAEARKRGIGLSPAVRALVEERVQEIDDAERLRRAKEWQRAEAWATCEQIKAGDLREVTMEQIDAEFDEALHAVSARRSR